MAKKVKHIFANNFMVTGDSEDIRDLDYRIYGLHKKMYFDGSGDITKVEYYKDYDLATDSFSNIAVQEDRVYTRNPGTGLLESRVMSISWYDEFEVVLSTKISVEKYYSAQQAFQANKKARQNLIDKASMYLYSQLMANDAPTADANVDDFESLTDSAQSKYVKSNTQPLLDIITNSTDNTKPGYRDYITSTMRATLLVILDISYI